eukprot:2121756-Alexandrium_andersonii.AAC.1
MPRAHLWAPEPPPLLWSQDPLFAQPSERQASCCSVGPLSRSCCEDVAQSEACQAPTPARSPQ